jgi:alcohol-forming fatty acyl-CoA reductase
MGKVLVEKLLRDCDELSRIYILVRTKKGVEPQQRREEYVNHMIFDLIRKETPKQLDKIHVVKGDVSVEGLEMNENDENELIENVNLVFHCAANVRFDQTLKDAVNFNTNGTHRVLKLAEKIKNLLVFIHVSTAYCHCNENVLEERYYPANENPFGVIEMVKLLKDETLAVITPKLLNGLPNTYALTKGLTEDLVYSYAGKFPIAIARPSIVTAAWKSPYPGWIEGFYCIMFSRISKL